MSTFEDRIQELVEIIEQSAEEYNENPPYSQDEENEFCQDGLIDPLSQMAEILREAEAAAYPKLAELIEQMDIIFNRTLNWAHGDTAVLEYYDDEEKMKMKTTEMTLMRAGPTVNLACRPLRTALKMPPFSKIQEGQRTVRSMLLQLGYANFFCSPWFCRNDASKLTPVRRAPSWWRFVF